MIPDKVQTAMRLSMQLIDASVFAKRIHGDKFSGKIAPYIEILRGISEREHIGPLLALKRALELGAGKITEGDELLFGAAAVQIVYRTEPPAQPEVSP